MIVSHNKFIKNLKQKKNFIRLWFWKIRIFFLFKNYYNISEITSYDPLYPNNINDIFIRYNIDSKATNNIDDLADKKFDIIICQSVIEHVTNPNLVISNMKNLLKKDGIIYINNPYEYKKRFKKSYFSKTHQKGDHISCYHISYQLYDA